MSCIKIINETLQVPRELVRNLFDYYVELQELLRVNGSNPIEQAYAKGVHDTLTKLFGEKVLPDGVVNHKEYVSGLHKLPKQIVNINK